MGLWNYKDPLPILVGLLVSMVPRTGPPLCSLYLSLLPLCLFLLTVFLFLSFFLSLCLSLSLTILEVGWSPWLQGLVLLSLVISLGSVILQLSSIQPDPSRSKLISSRTLACPN